MKKLLLIAVAALLTGCGNGSQKIGEGLYRSYDKENGVACYSWSSVASYISCVKIKR